ncbi:MAG: zinc transporter ZupT, partial [Bacteroidales bacterium]
MFNLDNSILFALTLTFFAGLSTGIGGIIVFFTKKLNKNFLSAALGISAGVMIFISFVELFTEAKTSLIG